MRVSGLLPSLTLADEVVLLTLGCARPRVGKALEVAGLADLRVITRTLQDRELIRVRRLHHPEVSSGAPLARLHRRLNAIIRSVDRPDQRDADLLLLVAFAGGLADASTADHLNARHRISSLGDRRSSPPPLLIKLCEEVGVSAAGDLAAKLLPSRVRVRSGELDPGVNSAVWGGGHGGGTLG